MYKREAYLSRYFNEITEVTKNNNKPYLGLIWEGFQKEGRKDLGN